MPEVAQKFMDDFSLLISIVEPKLLKNFLICLFGGQIGIGPFLNDIGGRGIALTIVVLLPINFFNFFRLIEEIKLIIF